jgi:hypothetical protein
MPILGHPLFSGVFTRNYKVRVRFDRFTLFFLVLKNKSGEAYSAIHVGLLFAVSNGA